jgi:hypothetical protein
MKYSVFYNTGKDSFFQSKTDFNDLTMANAFINSTLFTVDGFNFDFLLEDGIKLISGNPSENSLQFFKKAMMYAVDIPFEEFKR